MCSLKQKKMTMINKTLGRREETLYETVNQTFNQILLKYQTAIQISNRYSNIKQLLKYKTATQISNGYRSRQGRNQRELLPRNVYIQSFTSKAESSLNVELFIGLVRQFPLIFHQSLTVLKF